MLNKNPLLNEYRLNDRLTLKNHIIMAPMTRAMASDDSEPTDEMVAYYARRAEAGLIVTEGTVIAPDGSGHRNVPGIYSEAQIKQWKKVTDAVHERGGLIFSQIWHVGRVSHPSLLGGKLPISPSETTMTSRINRSEGLTYGKSRAATLPEIETLIATYASAAKNAIQAGFDGIEIHGANGYLIDQFLHYHTNHRQDQYGGNAENMARFALAVVHACGEAIGYDRVGLRLSPGGYLHEIEGDERDAAVFQYLLNELNKVPLAYVHTGNFNDAATFQELQDKTMTSFMREHYHGNLIACGSYTLADAAQRISQQEFDLIAIGRPFIANPDLIQLLEAGEMLKPYDASMLNTLY